VDDPDALARLRCSAALLACTPTVSARLVDGGRVLLEVMRPPHPVRDHAVVPTCWFRALIADAVEAGPPAGDVDRDRFNSLLACCVELGVRGGTTLLPANVLRVEAERSWMHLLALAAPLDAVRTVAVNAAQEDPDEARGTLLELHVDRELGVTVIGLASGRDDKTSSAAAELLRTIGMRLAVQRLEYELQCIADHPANGVPARRRRPSDER
jgi:hypothetical protein